ncbi:MAG: M14 family metallopeptidase, partial [Saprospiraceae bacterium]
MKKLLLLLSLGCCSWLSAQTPERYSEVQIDLQAKTMTELARLGIETDHGEWLPQLNRFTTALSATELQSVQQAGFSTKIRVADLQQDYLEKRQHPVTDRGGSCQPSVTPYPTPANYSYGSMGGYQTHDEILAMLDDMRAKFPDLITVRKVVSDSILTHEGRPQWFVKISDHADLNETEPAVLYTALHHAREPNGMSQMLFYMWHLLENYPTDPEVKYLVDHEELYFIPCLNPDGYIYNETNNPNGGGYWRKNRRVNGDGTFGVDLNRNYGYQWGFNDSGSSPNTGSETYRGPGPFSEPESRMLRDFGNAHQFLIANNYHTY